MISIYLCVCDLPGGRRVAIHKKRKFESGRPAAMTKLGEKRIHTVRVRGGNKKYRALRLETGNFSWGSESATRKTRLINGEGVFCLIFLGGI